MFYVRNALLISLLCGAMLALPACRSCTEAPPPRRAPGGPKIQGKLPPLPPAAVEVPSTPEPPKCVVIALPTVLEGTAPLKIQLPAEGGCSDGPASFSWDFGDGTPGVKEQTATHVYEHPGEYTATVTISDPDNRTDQDSVVITVTP